MDTCWHWGGVFCWCASAGKVDGSWLKDGTFGLGDGDISEGCHLHHTLSLHIEPNCSFCKAHRGKPANLMYKDDDIEPCGPQRARCFPSRMPRADDGRTQSSGQDTACLMDQAAPAPPASPPAHLQPFILLPHPALAIASQQIISISSRQRLETKAQVRSGGVLLPFPTAGRAEPAAPGGHTKAPRRPRR